ncbi:hypothetical protein KP509_36G053300 [Ceratopteris richardii]|uniref:Uncharacterized protein n=1 Tax=Ceratopteris richardii TaxID=49495 RepID=A0A8T2QCX8_CERRI|nr:hypothetical protein KP509_36G053300 [Ceratopteris richardii]
MSRDRSHRPQRKSVSARGFQEILPRTWRFPGRMARDTLLSSCGTFGIYSDFLLKSEQPPLLNA